MGRRAEQSRLEQTAAAGLVMRKRARGRREDGQTTGRRAESVGWGPASARTAQQSAAARGGGRFARGRGRAARAMFKDFLPR